MDCTDRQRPQQSGKLRRLQQFTIAIVLLATAGSPAHADNQADARRLLRISAVAQGFAEAARQQTETIISTYASIVAESTDTELPDSLKAQIAQCYEETFAWERFEPGIVAIFADNLSQEELTLLIDFFSDRSVPPPLIGNFRELIARAEAIEQLATEYIFSHSESCDARNVDLILEFLAAQGS
ncbi:MAG: hypothetical protein R3F41_11820 [Gammaproteobacteria bacterium]|nr:hypothetical protein [Pseudomonadales bacterium]MCP5348301.1 hypothetical protein [Pseudomonadales bacterium]